MGLSHKALSARPSSQGTCRRSAGCPQPRGVGRCRRGWSVQCGQTGVCCTASGQKQKRKMWLNSRTSAANQNMTFCSLLRKRNTVVVALWHQTQTPQKHSVVLSLCWTAGIRGLGLVQGCYHHQNCMFSCHMHWRIMMQMIQQSQTMQLYHL